MNRQQRRAAPRLGPRDIAALASIHIQQTYNFAQHYHCAPAFFETLKALQLQADLMGHAAAKANLPFHPSLRAVLDVIDTCDFKGPKLSPETHASRYMDFFSKPE